jgi:hypothetical protein
MWCSLFTSLRETRTSSPRTRLSGFLTPLARDDRVATAMALEGALGNDDDAGEGDALEEGLGAT